MGTNITKENLEGSGWVQVDDGTYQLKDDVVRLSSRTVSGSLDFFLGLVKAAVRPIKNDKLDQS